MTSSSLEIFPWTDNFATGIEAIDVQHQKLVELLNVLVRHMAFNADAPTLNSVYEQLRQYTIQHFADEECIWHEHFKDDPWEQWHKDAHQDFVDKIIEIKSRESELNLDQVIAEIVSFLTHWLALHIIESDKRMAKVVLALPSGISLERAKEQANEEMSGSTRVLINTVMGMYDKLAHRTVELTREISRRQQAERRLEQMQQQLQALKTQAEQTSSAKSEFLANMSHEIRAPMNSLIGLSEVLLNSGLTPDQHKMAQVIRDSAQSQLGILNDILDFSSIEAGKLNLSLEVFNLKELVETTFAAWQSAAEQKHLSFILSLDPQIPTLMRGDALRVRQIVSNFISNALKFSSGLQRLGEVEVKAKLHRLEPDLVWVDLAVSDNGIGMDRDTRRRLFRPFEPAHEQLQHEHAGTGLGLVISARLAQAMHGEIRVDSEVNKGTTFCVRLPFVVTEQAAVPLLATDNSHAPLPQSEPDRTQAIAEGKLILVAEDNPTNQTVIEQQLAMLGYQCDLATDGREALRFWIKGNYGLIITDIHMPLMDGYQLSEAIRLEEQKHGKARIPILALTANVLKGEADRCKAAGMDAYMAKPVTLRQLQAALELHLQNTQAEPETELQIMFVDDDSFMHDLMVSLLEEQGFTRVKCYESGASALDELNNQSKVPSVILLDINMPGMDGIEFVRHLAQRHYAGCLILVSGEDEIMLRSTEKLAREINLSVLGSIQKPPLPQRLVALLKQCEAQSQQRPVEKRKRHRKLYSAAEIQAAIDDHELVNFYQPKVSLPSGEWVGVETLVRWQHPQDGLVFPDQFIATAEAEGLIGKITRLVLKQAIQQARHWLDQGLHLRIAVNVSMEDLAEMDFADFVIDQAAQMQVPPELIVLEVTEGRLMQNYATALHVLTRLRLKRFRLSIDDFGTGHSSLAQLRDLPFDELKIDQGFTHQAHHDERLRAIFEASLDMAKHLNMEVVAEGIEDQDDWAFLLSGNTDIAQGYFISRPLPIEKLAEWHAQWQQRNNDRDHN